MKTKNLWSLTLLSALSVAAMAPAIQAQGTKPNRLVIPTNNVVKIALGERVTLSFPNVTRIITDDGDVARAFFQSNRAVLEGASLGSTTVEIYQASGTPKVITVQVVSALTDPPEAAPTPEPSPLTPLTPAPNPLPEIGGAITPSRSPLTVSLAVTPTPGNASQATFTITYGNPGPTAAQDVTIRFPLDERVSFVPGSGSPGARYDAALREVSWNLGIVPAGQVDQKLTLRVEPIERRSATFDSNVFIEDASKTGVSSNVVRYSTSTTPLLTIFALPDRFLAGKNGPVLSDVKGVASYTAVSRLQGLGVVNGVAPGRFRPAAATKRAEYAVMTLNGLNLRDLRDITQIKFVLGRRSIVNLSVQNAAGKSAVALIRNTTFEPGEHSYVWDGHIGANFAPPGRYTYICTAKDAKDPSVPATTLRGTLNIVPQTPLNPSGVPSFVDVKPSDWFARYLAEGERQNLLRGYKDKTFRPNNPISRVEATAIVVRALGLEDLAKQWQDKSVGFLDYGDIPSWANGSVNVATAVTKTNTGRPMMNGTPNNLFQPLKNLRRDEAALIVQRIIDRETTRRITVSGAIVPGTTVTINSRNVGPDDQGQFAFSFDLNTAELPIVAVIDTRDR